MISKQCKYSYYPVIAFIGQPAIRLLTVEQAGRLFETKSIYSITGYKNCITILLKDYSFDNENYYYLMYEPQTLELLWTLNDGCREIINSYLEYDCCDKTDMHNKFMSKILGSQ